MSRTAAADLRRALAALARYLAASAAMGQSANDSTAGDAVELTQRLGSLIGASDACGDDDTTARLIQRFERLLDVLARQRVLEQPLIRELERTGRETARQTRESYAASPQNCARARAAAEALLDGRSHPSRRPDGEVRGSG